MPDGNLTIIIQGKKRFSIDKLISETPFITSSINELKEISPKKDNKTFQATIDSIKDLALKIIDENPNIPTEASFAIKNIHSNSFLVNFVSSNMNISVEEKFKILCIDDLQKRALRCLKFMDVEFQKLSLKNDIQSKVRNDLDQQQREYFLNQQLKTIQEELKNMGLSNDEIESHKLKVKSSLMSNNDKDFEKTRLRKKIEETSKQISQLENNLNFIKKGSDSKVLDGVHNEIKNLKNQLEINEKKYFLFK